jgi:carboxylesterase type B
MSAAPGQFIVMNIQYRLAGFGFLGGAEVRETGMLNAGLLDQRFAMQWCSAILQLSVKT